MTGLYNGSNDKMGDFMSTPYERLCRRYCERPPDWVSSRIMCRHELARPSTHVL